MISISCGLLVAAAVWHFSFIYSDVSSSGRINSCSPGVFIFILADRMINDDSAEVRPLAKVWARCFSARPLRSKMRRKRTFKDSVGLLRARDERLVSGGTHGCEEERLTSAPRYSDCRDSSEAADRTCEAAAPVSSDACATPAMLPVTSLVPVEACATLRTISWVAAPCSSTAAAIEVATAADLADPPGDARDRRDRLAGRSLDLGDLPRDLVRGPGSLLGQRLHLGGDHREALTRSPARAASMVALRARRLVWPAMFEIRPTTSPMRETAALSSCTRRPV